MLDSVRPETQLRVCSTDECDCPSRADSVDNATGLAGFGGSASQCDEENLQEHRAVFKLKEGGG